MSACSQRSYPACERSIDPDSKAFSSQDPYSAKLLSVTFIQDFHSDLCDGSLRKCVLIIRRVGDEGYLTGRASHIEDDRTSYAFHQVNARRLAHIID